MAVAPQRSPHPNPDALGDALARIARRLRRRHQATGAARGANIGLTLDLALALLARFTLWPDALPFGATLLCLPLAGAALGALWGGRRAVTPPQAADAAERRLPLKERLSSALEFNAPHSAPPMLALQHADAAAHAQALKPSDAVPLRLPRAFWLMLPLLLLLALLVWLPFIPGLDTSASRADRRAVQSAGAALVQSARRLQARADALHDKAGQKQAQQLAKLGHRMAQGRLSRAQSLAALSDQQRQLAAQSSGTASANPGDAARPPGTNPGDAARSLASAGHEVPASPSASGKRKGAMPPAAPYVPAPATPKPTLHSAPSSAPSPSSSGSDKSAPGDDPARTAVQQAQDRQDAQQALEDARRQMTGQGQPKPSASGSPQPGRDARSGSPPPGHGSASGSSQSGHDARSGSSQPGHDARSGDASSPGGAGKTPSQSGHAGSSSSRLGGQPGTPGSPAPGGGTGKADKYALGRPLAPSAPSKGPTVYLGPPAPGQGQTVPARPGHGLPAAPAGGSRVPYQQALPRYRQGHEAALDKQNVPPSYRAAVRDYFNSLPKSPP